MNKLIYILIFFTSINLSAQIKITNNDGERISNFSRSPIEVGDIDKDDIKDSIYYNFQTNSIVCLLSSRRFEPMVIEYYLIADDAGNNQKNIFYLSSEKKLEIKHTNLDYVDNNR